MKTILYMAIAILLSNQASAYVTREIILKQGTIETKIPASDFKVTCVQDDFWGESDLDLNWKIPSGLTANDFGTFNKHNLLPGACEAQLKDLAALKTKDGELSVNLNYLTKLSVIIWSDTCSLIRLETADLKIKNSDYEFSAGDNTVIAQLTPEKCMSLSEGWFQSAP